MKTIIIGLGNPILADDSVGIKTARAISSRINHPDIQVTEAYAGGIRLMELMAGYERAVIIDAMITGNYEPGYICRLSMDDLSGSKNLLCAHDTSLLAALEIGKIGGLHLPSEITLWGIEAKDVENYTEELTMEVARAVPKAVDAILKDLKCHR